MKEITEDYCDFETAKLLKEKGFESEDCHTAYDENGQFFWHGDYSKDRKGVVDAPTLQMAMKWLREKHELHINVFVGRDESFDADGVIADEWHFWSYNIQNISGDVVYDAYGQFDVVEYQTHEEVCDAAIKYVLENLI